MIDLWRIVVFVLKHMLHNEFPLFDTSHIEQIIIYCSDGIRVVELGFPDKEVSGRTDVENYLRSVK